MIIPINFRLTNGSFTTTLPKPMGNGLKLDELLEIYKNVKLIAECVENGVLIRHPNEDEKKRFQL